LIEIFDPIGAGWAGLEVQQDLGFDWFNIEATYPDDKVYFRSYNPATGALRASTTFDLATGLWAFPAGSTIGGAAIGDGDVHGPASSVDNQIALFDGATGKTIKSGVVVGDVVGSDLQPTPTDTTAGGVLTVGSFGLGTTGALSMPIGTTLERPVVTVDGQTRINTTTGVLEYYYGSTWNNVPKLAVGYINGLSLSTSSATLTINSGSCASFDSSTLCVLSSALSKTLSATWVAGTGGGRPSSVPIVIGQFYRVFLISKPDGTSDAGFDTSTTAANLLAVAASAGYTKYRRIGWVQCVTSGATTITTGTVVNNTHSLSQGSAILTQQNLTAGTYSYNATNLPPNVVGLFDVMLERNSGGTGHRYIKFANALTVPFSPSVTNFDMAASNAPTCAKIEYYVSGLNAVIFAVSGTSEVTINQMGWIDDTSNLLNV